MLAVTPYPTYLHVMRKVLNLENGQVGPENLWAFPFHTAGMGLLMATENGWEIDWSLFEFPNHLHR